jgi:hypothetical protein
VQPNVWERQRMPTVEGLSIVGEHAEADGIEAKGTFQLTLRGVHIRKCRHGVRLVERNRNVLIDGCHIYENSGIGVFYDHVNLHQSNISASHISYCQGGGVVVRGGDVRNIHIAGCDIEANMGSGRPPTANVLLDCADGNVGEVAITGNTIQHSGGVAGCANIRMIGHAVTTRGGQQVKLKNGNLTIGDNVLSDVKTNIHLVGVRGVTITGNTFWKGFEHHLLVEDSEHVIVGPNMMERNPLYGAPSSKNGVVFQNSNDCTVQGLHLHHAIGSEAGLILDRCRRMHVTGCTVLDCENAAIAVKECTDSRVAGNFIRQNEGGSGAGVKVTGGSGNQIAE